uniref:ARAD1A12364p n=1 Tax=Blastobotrys adeninivorans TaxID=409370 RepID=A0A060T304_BLAAD
MLKQLVNELNSHAGMSKTRRRVVVGLTLVLLFILFINDHQRSRNGSSSQQQFSASSNMLEMPNTPILSKSSGAPVPWGVLYSPLTSAGTCKSHKQIYQDFADIKRSGFSTVRVFSTDCGVLQALDHVKNLNIAVGLMPLRAEDEVLENHDGVSGLLKSISNQLADLEAWGHWDRIAMIIVGSQGVFSGEYSAQELVQMLRFVRTHVSTHNKFKGAITTAEPVQSWASAVRYNAISLDAYKTYRSARSLEKEPLAGINEGVFASSDDDLCAAVDVVGLVVQPYFSAVGSYDAGTLLRRDVEWAEYLCSDNFVGGKHRTTDYEQDYYNGNEYPFGSGSPDVAVLEAGWPRGGQRNEDAIPGTREQLEAVTTMVNVKDPQSGKRVPVVLYSYDDELAVDAGELGVETSFGVRSLY